MPQGPDLPACLQSSGVRSTVGSVAIVGFAPVPLEIPALKNYVISGVTRDATGAVLPYCTVKLFQTINDVQQYVCLSDANGNYSFNVFDGTTQWYLTAYKAGSPDVAGTSVNTLVGV